MLFFCYLLHGSVEQVEQSWQLAVISKNALKLPTAN